MLKKIIIANWKMNPETTTEALALFSLSKELSKKYRAKIIICPPFPFLSIFSHKKMENFALGSQDVFYEKKGPYTGEVSAAMLNSFNVEYSIIGHSERRSFGETNEVISKKVSSALRSKLTPILCVGERERDGEGSFFAFLKEEILSSLKQVSKKDIAKVIIAYEPIWAISTDGNHAMDTDSIHETVIFIRKILSDKFGKAEASKIKIVYGGSVDKRNARNILFGGGCDGVLVGKSSLSGANFEDIVKSISYEKTSAA